MAEKDESQKIDQNLFKDFDYNNIASHKDRMNQDQMVEGVAVKTTIIDDENKKVKA